jgi:phosphoribosylanthranilate isomerase
MIILPNTVKICSLQRVNHVEYVCLAGADLYGLIFAAAKRQVTPSDAREIVREARRLSSHLLSVGVFVEQSPEEINRLADKVGLDLVQLHQFDPTAFGTRIERPVLLAIHTDPSTTVESVAIKVAAFQKSGSLLAGLVVDGYAAGVHGGAGVRADWAMARQIAERYPTLLAGGLNPTNVAEAIDIVGPAGVDVSSGVETDGRKDRHKIISFVQRARRAMAHYSIGQVNDLPLGQSAEPV